jgi:hypothetical protein
METSVMEKPALTDMVEVGSIFESSWGYDQTNVTFYEVVRMSAASVWIKSIRKERVSESANITKVVPVPGSFDPDSKPALKRPDIWNDHGTWRVGLTMSSFAAADLWDGEPVYETTEGWGH